MKSAEEKRQEKIRKQEKLIKEKAKKNKEFKESKLKRERIQPIRNADVATQLQKQLDRNMKILKAMEDEYIESQRNRENLNEELEKEGYHSLEEKVEAMRLQAFQAAERIQEEVIKAEQTKHGITVE